MKPSPTAARVAAAVSVLALAVSLGGTGYAAGKIGAKQLKKNAVSSKTVKNDSLTGADIAEASLGTVPSATTATTATTAKAVAGFKVSKVNATSATEVVLFSEGGLTVKGQCSPTGISLSASTSVAASSIITTFVDVDNEDLYSYSAESGSFNPSTIVILNGLAITDAVDPGLATFQYDNPQGTVITGTITTQKNSANVCHFAGTVTLT